MNPLATLANGAWLVGSFPAWRRFNRALDRPDETQRSILQQLLRNLAESEYGRSHGFADIRDYEQFRDRVPLVDYDALEPWIDRIRRGDERVLTSDRVTRLVPTSGSSGARKLIPFTGGLQREFNAAIAPWIFDLCRMHPRVPLGPAYWSISPAIPDDTHSAVPIGFDDDSAYLGGIRQRIVEAALAVPSALRHSPDLDSFRYATLLCLLRQPALTLISIWHPSFLELLLDAIPAFWNELLGDVANGGCRRGDGFAAELFRSLSASPNPLRANALRELDPTDPHSLWPNLRVVGCWSDAQAAMATAALQLRLPRVVIQPKGLLATEAFVSIPFRDRHPVAINSHFFEFLQPDGTPRMAHQLQCGETYGVVVTTAGGLVRYRLGDLVEVDGQVGSTPSLRFLGRGSTVSDVCGEKLSEVFVTRAIAAACQSVGTSPAFAMLAPDRTDAGHWHYTLFIEGTPPRGLDDALDQALRANPHYNLCRDLGQLRPLRCWQIPGRGDESYYQAEAGRGLRLGDIKPQALSPRTDWRKHFTDAREPLPGRRVDRDGFS